MAATTISRANIGTDDDGSGTTGTVINAAYVGLIYNNIDALFSSTTGIVLNQVGGDTAILSMESSDVAHGMTSNANTDQFAIFLKYAGADGGLRLRALTETTVALGLDCYATTEDTTKSGAAIGALYVSGALKSGTTVTTMGSSGNIAVFASFGTVRFILDGKGESHQDVGTAWTNFDAHDDVALLTALSGAVTPATDPLKLAFADFLHAHRGTLERAGIVTINDHPGGDGSVFINWSRTHMLEIGAIRQIGQKVASLESRLMALEAAA